MVLSHANRKFIGLVGSGHIEVAALGIVDVLAVVRGGNLIIAGFEAKLVAPDEAISRQTLDYDNSDEPRGTYFDQFLTWVMVVLFLAEGKLFEKRRPPKGFPA